ncbi:MAG: biotin/lipoyl-binding protein, partial [Ginsengibacter sp.]
MKYSTLIGIITLIVFSSCNGNKKDFDASGNFEADEVIVSAQQNGELLSYSVEEGKFLKEGAVIGQIDVAIPKLQKEQTEAAISSLKEKTTTSNDQVEVIKKQITVQEAQLQNLYRERQRTQNLVNADAAPRKQLDDINAQIDQ